MEESSHRDLIIRTFEEKSILKQDVFENTKNVFVDMKTVLRQLIKDLKTEVANKDKRVKVEYTSNSQFEARLKFGGDILIFHMHTNVFDFDKSHHMWKSSYIKEDRARAFCGMISIYNSTNAASPTT